jgi:hypothetical protein
MQSPVWFSPWAGMQGKSLLICDDEPAFGRFVQNVAEDLGTSKWSFPPRREAPC